MKEALKNDFIHMTSVSQEILDARDYVRLTPLDRANIERSKIIPPKLGEKSFGKIMVTYKIPIFKQRHV